MHRWKSFKCGCLCENGVIVNGAVENSSLDLVWARNCVNMDAALQTIKIWMLE